MGYTAAGISSDPVARRANAPGLRGRSVREVDRRELTATQQETVEYIVGILVEPGDIAAIVDPARIRGRRAGIVERGELAVCQLESVRRAGDRIAADCVPGLVDGPGQRLSGPGEVDGRVVAALSLGRRCNAQRNAEGERVDFPL